MRTNSISLIGCALLPAFLACAHAGPSDELLKARQAYSNAEAGPATALDPADFHEARVALDSAENAAAKDPQSYDARQRAYMALRRSELADAQGKTAAAVQARDESAQLEAKLKDQLLSRTQNRLANANEQNSQVRGALASTQGQLANANQHQVQTQAQLDTATNQQAQTQAQLATATNQQAQTQAQLNSANVNQQATQAQLATEHDARIAAEKREMDALQKLGAVKDDERGLVLTLSGSVIFASNKDVLLASAQRRLDDVAKTLRDSPRNIRVEGHTDSRGGVDTNQSLSQRRAESVMNYLISRGVPAARISAIGLGSTHPVADNGSAEGRANNRRVEIILLRDARVTAER